MKEKLAMINIPDASKKELEELLRKLHVLFEKPPLVNLPYQFIFVVGKEWKTMNKDDITEILASMKVIACH